MHIQTSPGRVFVLKTLLCAVLLIPTGWAPVARAQAQSTPPQAQSTHAQVTQAQVTQAHVTHARTTQPPAGNNGHFTVNGKVIDIKTFDAQVNRMLREIGVPAVSVAIMDHNKVVYAHAYGYRNLATKLPVNDETIFEACSLSKNFLVFAVYQLIDKGMLDLDKPLYQYLPYPPLEHDPRYKLITARMVLSHSSGLENWKWENNPDTLEILSDPGTKFVYSGEGYQYLAKVIESIVHQPYDVYIKDLVFKPLGLKRTFARFEQNGAYPVNYALGHDNFGKSMPKIKRKMGWPASGVNVTAQDYGTLIVSLFDKRYISDQRVRDLLTPAIPLTTSGALHYYGPGFELLFRPDDTLISQGGNNSGYKAKLLYSVTRQCGLVYFSNSDLGSVMADYLMAISAGLDVSPFTQDDYYCQYPCYTLDLFNVYKDKGADSLYARIEQLKAKTGGNIGENVLNQLVDMCAPRDIQVSKRLAEENTGLYPNSPQAFYLLGEVDLYLSDYNLAYKYLRKAKDLKYSGEPTIDYDIKRCEQKIAEK
jgi:CubicO group peptidase (beta-lactamase class C family)